MKRFITLTAFAAFAACTVHAQAVSTTVCDVIKDPASFDGKMVTIKGTVVAGFDQFMLNDGDCGKEIGGIWLEYPAGSKAKAGANVMIDLQPAKNFAGTATAANRAPVTLNKDKEFKTFDSALSSSHNNGNMCLGCTRYTVQATITGRLDGVKNALIKREGGKITGLGGFGNLNAYPARLVIASVAEVTTKEIDYSKADAAAKVAQKAQQNQQQGPPGTGAITPSLTDARTNIEKLVATMAAGPITTQMQKDLSMLPKPKEQTGVVLQTGTDNEVSATEGAPGAIDTSDGLIYNCTINRDRLPNNATVVALLHVSQHIADVRAPIEGNEQAPMVILENNAWAVTTTLAIFGGEKVVAVPGGNLLWDSAWPQADQVGNMQTALSEFLSKEEQLNR